jgi:hypothetical protein
MRAWVSVNESKAARAALENWRKVCLILFLLGDIPHHERVFHPHIRRVIGNQPATNCLHEIRDGIRVLFLIPFLSVKAQTARENVHRAKKSKMAAFLTTPRTSPGCSLNGDRATRMPSSG